MCGGLPASRSGRPDTPMSADRLAGPGYRRVLLKLGGEMFGGGGVGVDPKVVKAT
jgi:uridylate kinase